MVDRSVVVRLVGVDLLTPSLVRSASAAKGLDSATTRAVGGVRSLGTSAVQSAAGLEKKAVATQRASKKLSELSPALLAVGIGVGAVAKSYMDFDKAMSAVQANTQATGAELSKLRQLAIDLGSATQYSGAEAAQGINEMAKAGVSARDIMGGGLKGALDLAAAGQLDVARAAEIAATAVGQFGLKGSQVSHVADLYAAAANKAQGSVDDVAMAMKYAGVTAKSMGVNIEEATGTVALFASKGIIGEQAGTSFRSMLMSLTAPSKAAAKTMQELGINVYDSQGKFIGMAGVAGQLQQALSGLPEAERNAALGRIFGNEAMNAAVTLYQAGSAEVQRWTKDVNDAGLAQRQAAQLTNNLTGDIERLGGAIDGAVLKGGGGLNELARGLTQGLTGLVDAASEIPAPVMQGAVALGVMNLAGRFLPDLGAKFDTVRTKAGGFRAEMAAAQAPSAAMVSSYRALGFSADVAARAAEQAAPRVGAMTAAARAAGGGMGILKTAGSGLLSILGGPWGVALGAAGVALGVFASRNAEAKQKAEELKAAIVASGDAFSEQSSKAVANQLVTDGTLDKFREYGFEAKQVIQAVMGIGNAHEQMVAQMAQLPQGDYQTLSDSLDSARDSFGGARDAAEAERLAQEAASSAAAGAAGPLAGVKQGNDSVAQSAEDATKQIEEMKTSIEGLGGTAVTMREAQRGYHAAIDATTKSLKDNGQTFDITTEKGRANQASLDKLRVATLSYASATYEQTGSLKAAAGVVEMGRDKFVELATKMYGSKKRAEELADELRLTGEAVRNLAKQKSPEIQIKVNNTQALAAIRRVATELSGLPGMTAIGLAATVGSYASRASGGILPGYTPGRDVHWFTSPTGGRLGLSGGEAVMRPEWTRAVGAARVDAWNRAASTGGTGAVRSAMGLASGGIIGGSYASGGQVGEIKITGQGIVLPMRAAVRVQWSESDLKALTVDLMETITGIKQDVPESVRKVRDDWDKIRAVIRGSVEDSSKLAESLRDAQAKITTTGASGGSAVSGAKVSYSGALGSSQAKRYLPQILAMGAKYNVAPELIAAVMKQESGFNPNAGSTAGAGGLMQLMPGTFRSLGVRGSLKDPNANIEAGTKYLAQQLAAFGGNIVKALQAYNAGPGAVRSGAANRYAETKNYVRRITGDAGVKSLAGGGRFSSSAAKDAAASASSSLALEMIANAKLAIGNMYRYGGGHGGANQKTDLRRALVDCSGLLNVSLSKVLNRNVSQVSDDFLKGKNAKQLSVGQALKTAGAFVGRVGSGKNGHVAISLGDGTILEAPRTGLPVRIRKTTAKEWNAAAWDLRLGSPTTSSRGSSGGGSVGSDMDSARRLAEAIADRDAARLAVEANQLRAEQRDRLLAVLERQQPAMERLALAREDTEKRLGEATQSLADLEKEAAAYAAGVADKATGRGSLVGMFRDGDSTRTWTQAAAGMRIVIDETRKFAGSIQDLKALGLDDALLRQVVDAGVVDGQAIAKSIQDGGQLAVDELNQLSDDLGLAGKGLGQTTVDTLYQSGIDGAKGLVKGLQDTLTGQQDQIRRIGEFIAAQIWSGYGLTGPTGTVRGLLDQRVKTGLGGGGTVKIASPNVTVQVTLDGKQLDARTRVQVEQAIRPAVEAALVGVR